MITIPYTTIQKPLVLTKAAFILLKNTLNGNIKYYYNFNNCFLFFIYIYIYFFFFSCDDKAEFFSSHYYSLQCQMILQKSL